LSAPFPPEAPVQIAPGYRFQWEEAQQVYVLLYPEGMITLNDAASEILKRCDGSRTASSIIADLEQQFPGAELKNDVLEFLEDARDKGWIRSA
jgi:pyrroloquinoline quinone biosynthesis protein D